MARYNPLKPGGPKMPQKYPSVGPNYQMYGEQPGWIYDWRVDKYTADPRLVNQWAEAMGLKEPAPKQPSLGSIVLPIAAVGGLGALAQSVGKGIGEEGILTSISKLPSQLGGLLGIGGGATESAASTATGGLMQFPAFSLDGTIAAPAVGTSAGAGAASSPIFSLGSGGLFGEGPMPIGNYLPGLLGTIGLADIFMNKRHGARGAAQGALSGAGLGFTLGGPVGAAIGAPLGGLLGYFGRFGDKDRWKTEGNRLSKLVEAGTYVPESLLASMPTHGRKKSELIRKDLPNDFRGFDSAGQWVNNKFANSRKESDLASYDIVNYAAFAENDPTWFQKPLEERLKIAQEALDAGAVREHHGTIDINWDKLRKKKEESPVAETTSGLLPGSGFKPTGRMPGVVLK